MDRFSVVIAGGGVAAIEGLLRLRRLVGDEAKITLLAPNEEFAFRALSVKEPFALGAAERHSLRQIARDASAEWVQDTFAWLDPDGQVVHTAGGAELAYDALLIAVHSSTVAQVPAAKTVQLTPGEIELQPDRIVALPAMSGPGVRGLPGAGGFIPIDAHCAVPGTDGRIFAAGDATAFPVKHGGLGSEQADTAAAAIAYLAGVDVEAEPFQPVIRGMLLTGAAPLYMTARLIGSGSFESEVSDQPLWPSGAKVAAEELNDYLAKR